MNFTEKLESAESMVCLGMDPVLEKIPLTEQSPEKKIVKFYSDILQTIETLGAVKPNYAFFAQYGFPGLRALKKIISESKNKKIPVILDAKRGDIGKSSAAYAKEAFDFWKADAVTVSPYMGRDSVKPFIERCSKGKGVYVLVRTSNPGAEDIQELECNSQKKVFMKTAEKVAEWHQEGMGAVAGATNPTELKKINDFFASNKKKVPLLIPGVGEQGGSETEAVKALSPNNLKMHRINSSSGINYAYLKQNTEDYAEAAAKAAKKLDTAIRKTQESMN